MENREAMTCTCPHIMLDHERTDATNWNPECLAHGTESEWYRSEAQVTKRQLDGTRLRVMMTLARLRRRDEITSQAAHEIMEMLHWEGE